MSAFLRETRLIFNRNLIRTLRNPVWIIIGMFQPIIYLLLFAPLLDRLPIPGFSEENALNGFVPGMLVMIALFGASYAGFGILDDLHNGVIERFSVTPASRPALLLGMVLQDVVVFLVQCLVLVVTATLMGMRADPGGMLVLFGLMALLGLLMVSASYALAVIVRDHSAIAAMLTTITQPLLLLSGVLLPLALAPRLLQIVAEFNPFAHAVETARALTVGQLGHDSIPVTFAIVAVLVVLAVGWSVSTFRRATA